MAKNLFFALTRSESRLWTTIASYIELPVSEIQQQANRLSCGLEVIKALSREGVVVSLRGFQLDDHDFVDEDVREELADFDLIIES